jgi:2-(1,2-epoxy-1,2-dihydrophenyl)acetyl-CoA isomerase
MGTITGEQMVTLRVDGPVAELVLARADARNAINGEWVQQLDQAANALADGSDARALLIRADGPAFTVGGDLAHFNAHLDELPTELTRMITQFHGSLKTLAELDMPVVCAAHGSVAGGGLGLLWASDVVVLSEETKLTTAFARLGLSGDGGSSWYLPRLVGERKALELMYNATVLSAREAVDLGMANLALPHDQMLDAARGRAAQLAAGPTLAYGTMRRLIRGAYATSLSEGLGAEIGAMTRLGATQDVQRGIRAFSVGERPVFEGN